MKKKSLLALFLVGIGALLPLTACQNTDAPNSEGRTVQAEEATTGQVSIAEEETVSEEAVSEEVETAEAAGEEAAEELQ